MASEPSALELKMDPATLYREDSFTERPMGVIGGLPKATLHRLTDRNRKIRSVGDAQLTPTPWSWPASLHTPAATLRAAAGQPSPDVETQRQRPGGREELG